MPLPTFLVAGERRSGSTAMGKWLQNHPDVFVHPSQDLEYFVDDGLPAAFEWTDGHVDTNAWLAKHSADEYSGLFSEAGDQSAIGEKSADYLFWRPSHRRIAEFVPDARIILTLRNPVERAWSHYWNELGKGRETLDFEDALEAEDERCAVSDYGRFHLSYRTRGKYDESLSDFLRVIPREQVLVTTLEQNRAQPEASMRRMYEFIGVDPDLGLEIAGTRHNPNWTTVSRTRNSALLKLEEVLIYVIRRGTRRLISDPVDRRELQIKLISKFRKTKADFEMEGSTRKRLAEFYRPHVGRLEEILGRRITEWEF